MQLEPILQKYNNGIRSIIELVGMYEVEVGPPNDTTRIGIKIYKNSTDKFIAEMSHRYQPISMAAPNRPDIDRQSATIQDALEMVISEYIMPFSEEIGDYQLIANTSFRKF